jgi:hypothetical protein
VEFSSCFCAWIYWASWTYRFIVFINFSLLLFIFLFCFFETVFCYVAKAGLELTISLHSAGTTGVCCQAWQFSSLFFCGTGVWTQGLHLEPLHQPFFVMDFFEIGSHKLFPWAGFKPWSSWSLPPE